MPFYTQRKDIFVKISLISIHSFIQISKDKTILK